MLYGNAITEIPIGGEKFDYRIKKLNETRWIEIEPNNQHEYIFVDIGHLSKFIDELMEIRDYINTHPEFQGGSEE